MRRRPLIALAALLIITAGTSLAARQAPPALAENNGVAATAPLMGWSSWSFLRSGPTAAGIEAQADALKSSGLSSHGYSYVNLDDFTRSAFRWPSSGSAAR
jgi:alpha-galactosidase